MAQSGVKPRIDKLTAGLVLPPLSLLLILTTMKPTEPSIPPRAPSRQRAPLMALGVGHPSRANIPTIAISSTAPLNVKPKRVAKPATTMSDGPQVTSKESHNELKAILADPPRRRASSSAVEVLSVPPVARSVSAPMVYRAPGRSPSPPPTPSPSPVSDYGTKIENPMFVPKGPNKALEALAGQVAVANAALCDQGSTRRFSNAT